jgi:hypothetical protein
MNSKPIAGLAVCVRRWKLSTERRSQLLQETERFCRWRQEKVAKIVQYGPPFRTKVAGRGGGHRPFFFAKFNGAGESVFERRDC